MKVQVELCAGPLGLEMPMCFRFGRREVEIVETVDRWYGPNYCYFKIKGNDGYLYILRFEQGRAEWELTMFQSRGAYSTSPEGYQFWRGVQAETGEARWHGNGDLAMRTPVRVC